MTRLDPVAAEGPFAIGQLALPFYSDAHRALADDLAAWIARERSSIAAIAELPRAEGARAMVRALGDHGWLEIATEGDMQSVCLCRQAFAWLEDLCDFAFALQGLAAFPLRQAGRGALVADLASGRALGALALTERGAGSDLAAVTTRAERTGEGFTLSGEKAWIGHAGVADIVVTLARTGGGGAFGLSLFAVPGAAPGVTQSPGPEMIAPRALGSIHLQDAAVPEAALLGAEGLGFVTAVQTIDAFRMSVGAAATGFARAALQAAVSHVRQRRVEGRALAERQLVKAALADMAVALNTAELSVAQAAWEWDRGVATAATRSSLAKLHASEAAHQVIDMAVQLLGAAGLAVNAPTERLYRQVRSLRIYEGTSEMQRLAIGQAVAAGQL